MIQEDMSKEQKIIEECYEIDQKLMKMLIEENGKMGLDEAYKTVQNISLLFSNAIGNMQKIDENQNYKMDPMIPLAWKITEGIFF